MKDNLGQNHYYQEELTQLLGLTGKRFILTHEGLKDLLMIS